MEIPLRLYGLNGCPKCLEAMQFLSNARVPVNIVEVTGDPVIDRGVKALINEPVSRFPILVSFMASSADHRQEVIVGYQEDDYKRVTDFYHTYHRPSTLDSFSIKSVDSGQAAQVVAEQTPAPAGIV